jgi:competence protein ComGC
MHKYGIYFILILIIFVILLISDVAIVQQKHRTTTTINDEGINNVRSLLSSQTEPLKRDCNIETVFSMDDYQCSVICRSDKSTFRSKNGVCVNSLIFESTIVENECSAKAGVLAFLIGDPMFGRSKMLCLSIDLGIQPDSVKKQNLICKNGSIDINYVKGFPQLKDCKCGSDSTLAMIEATSIVRTHGVCVSKNIMAPLNHNSLLFNNDAV